MISRKKIIYPVNAALRKYLKTYQRERKLPVSYPQLKFYTESLPLIDYKGKDTLWETVMYPQDQIADIHNGLKQVYAMLKAGGDIKVQKHLYIERIDYCSFGNSHPFRIKIVNSYNDVHDYFYIKIPDASRVYGLELEHILSPNQLNYLVDEHTLVEEHIAGIPGDVFLPLYSTRPEFNPKRIAKEFVKFNERCFVRLLGDMRSYNFVVDITPDIEDYQYRIRCIDFDQQSYEGRKNLYLPQFFKENYAFVDLSLSHLNKESIAQYQFEERTMITYRVVSSRYRIKELLDIMTKDEISTTEKIKQLKDELNSYFNTTVFKKCKSMGDIVKTQLKHSLQKNLMLVQKDLGKHNE